MESHLSRNVAFSKQKMIIENRPHDPKTYQFPRPPDTQFQMYRTCWVSMNIWDITKMFFYMTVLQIKL